MKNFIHIIILIAAVLAGILSNCSPKPYKYTSCLADIAISQTHVECKVTGKAYIPYISRITGEQYYKTYDIVSYNRGNFCWIVRTTENKLIEFSSPGFIIIDN